MIQKDINGENARHMEGSLTGHEGTGAGSSALIHGMAVV